jgi:hypothetical protein
MPVLPTNHEDQATTARLPGQSGAYPLCVCKPLRKSPPPIEKRVSKIASTSTCLRLLQVLLLHLHQKVLELLSMQLQPLLLLLL